MQPNLDPDGKSMPINERVKWARIDAGLTLDELRIEVGAGKGMPQKWEQPENSPSHRKPSRETLGAIAMATGIREDWLSKGQGAPRDPRKVEIAGVIRVLIQEYSRTTSTRGEPHGGVHALEAMTGVPSSMWEKWARTGPRNLGEAEDLEEALVVIKNETKSKLRAEIITKVIDRLHRPGAGVFKILKSERTIQQMMDGEETPIRIPVFTVRAAAGEGYENGPRVVSNEVRLSATHIREVLRVSPNNLAILHVEGDSMDPIIYHGDAIFIDTRPPSIVVDGIYLLRQDDALLVKQLQRLPGGVIQVSSRNPAYAPYIITEENSGGFEVLGKVVGKCGRI